MAFEAEWSVTETRGGLDIVSRPLGAWAAAGAAIGFGCYGLVAAGRSSGSILLGCLAILAGMILFGAHASVTTRFDAARRRVRVTRRYLLSRDETWFDFDDIRSIDVADTGGIRSEQRIELQLGDGPLVLSTDFLGRRGELEALAARLRRLVGPTQP
jgi:hypothetical protein